MLRQLSTYSYGKEIKQRREVVLGVGLEVPVDQDVAPVADLL